MAPKPTYKELAQKLKAYEKKEVANKRMEEQLRRRLTFEKMLADISTLAISATDQKRFQENCLEKMGNALDVSRIYIFEHCHLTHTMDNTVEWTADGIFPQKQDLQKIPVDTVPWWSDMMLNDRIINYHDIENIPGEEEKKILRYQNIKSIVVVPIFIQNEYFGFIGFDECRKHREWWPEDVNILKAISQIIAGTLARINASETLRYEREQIFSIFGSINQMVYVADPDTYEILFVNDALKKELKKDAVGGICYKEFQGLNSPCEFCTNNIILKKKYEPYQWEFHNPYYNRDFIIIDRIIKWPDSRDVRLEIAFDITERKKFEEALKRNKNRYQAIVEDMPVMVCRFIPDGTLTFVNSAYCNYFKKQEEELIGYNFFQFVPEKDQARVKKQFMSLSPTHPIATYEHQVVSPDGTNRWQEWTDRALFDDQGNILEYQSVGRDITDARRAREEKEQMEKQLRQAQKMEAIGMLAGGVAHDLNNILTGIVTYPEFLLMQIPQDSPIREPIKTIQKSGERAATIVQDLATLARRGIPTTEVTNLNHIVSEYLESPEHRTLKMYHPDIMVETNLERDLLNMEGNPVHLSKTVMNLISNAAEAMPDGGKISISTENFYIDRPIGNVDQPKEGDYILLTVSDTGMGISSEDMEKIFEPFYTKKIMGRSGTGLGMTVVWGTVKDHNGHIDIQSKEAEGTRFSLYFPATRKKIAMKRSPCNFEDVMGKGESIVVVDDVVEQRQIASGILKRLGYTVTSVSSGEEAVDYMKHNRADLLLLDMIMDPGMSGLDTYKKILEFQPGQKAIIVSGYSETDRVKEMQRLGAGSYVKKPYLIETLALAVQAELGEAGSSGARSFRLRRNG
mgnify:CR=1 FL=1